MKRSAWLAVLIGLLPVLCVWVHKVLLHPRPFWIVFYDPETLYFYNALRIATLRWPLPLETPGGPVILLSVPLALLTGRTPLTFDVFRLLAYSLTFVLTIGAAYLLARVVLRELPPILGAIAIFTFFAAPQALEYFTVWSPEAVYFVVGSIAAALLWRELHDDGSTLLAALAIGLCIATKFTFVAWVPAHLLAMLAARRWRKIPIAMGGYLAGFVLFTLPIIPNYGAIFTRLFQFASRSGEYGSGSASLAPLGVLAGAVASAKVWHAWLLLIAIGAAIAAGRKRELVPLLVFAATATLMTYAVAIRYMPPRYILANGVTAAMLFAIAAHAVQRRDVLAAVCVLAVPVGAKSIAGDLRTHRERLAEGVATHHAIHSVVRGVVVYGWRAPEPSFALRILAYDKCWLRAIETRYPNDGHYNPWHGGVILPQGRTSWDYAVVNDEDAKAIGGTKVGRVRELNIIRR
ncbi:MAG TPA: hypothetical protein VGR02_19480 [Thermoanaerobaculia bacterium]|jgi:hypothetical protein|nr:hypothetical protein [Thermoanaerobaculia bacterium]